MIMLRKINYVALSAIFLLLWQVSAQADTSVGRVIIATGDFVAVPPEGPVRPLKRKSEFYTQEILKTGADTTAQIRFIDDALMSLTPNSEFRVNEYHYDAITKENPSSITTLTQGGLRTITGLIAKQKPPAYKVITPVATIGVRGTDFQLDLKGNGLNVAFWSGAGVVSNAAGSLELGEGAACQFALVQNATSAPVCQSEPLVIPFDAESPKEPCDGDE